MRTDNYKLPVIDATMIETWNTMAEEMAGDQVFMIALVETLQEEDVEAQLGALVTLEEIGPAAGRSKEVVEAVTNRLFSPGTPPVQQGAARTLGLIFPMGEAPDPVLKTLLTAFSNPEFALPARLAAGQMLHYHVATRNPDIALGVAALEEDPRLEIRALAVRMRPRVERKTEAVEPPGGEGRTGWVPRILTTVLSWASANTSPRYGFAGAGYPEPEQPEIIEFPTQIPGLVGQIWSREDQFYVRITSDKNTIPPQKVRLRFHPAPGSGKAGDGKEYVRTVEVGKTVKLKTLRFKPHTIDTEVLHDESEKS